MFMRLPEVVVISKLPKNDLKIAQNFLTLSESLLRKQVRGRLIFEHPDLQWISSFSFLRWNLSFLRKHPLKHNYISGFMWLFFFGFTHLDRYTASFIQKFIIDISWALPSLQPCSLCSVFHWVTLSYMQRTNVVGYCLSLID